MADPATMGVMAGTSIVGGFLGARRAAAARKRAGTTLANAYGQAAQDAWKLPGYVNPAIAGAYGTAGEDVFNTAYGGAANIEDRAAQARGDVSGALATGRGDITGAVATGREDLGRYLDPYAQAGVAATQSLSELAGAKAPTLEQLQMDPGYAFRLAQGQKAMERSAAGRGMLQSGSFAKSLAGYSQDLASQEYANAFDRYMKGQEARRQSLTSLVDAGGRAAATAGTTMAELGLRGGTAMGELGLRGGEAMGKFGMEGTRIAGDWLNEAARYKGNAGMRAMDLQTGNILNAGDRATGYQLGGAQATAGSQVGVGDAWANFYNQTGQTLSDLTGYYSYANQPASPWSDTGYATGLPTTGGTGGRRLGRRY